MLIQIIELIAVLLFFYVAYKTYNLRKKATKPLHSLVTVFYGAMIFAAIGIFFESFFDAKNWSDFIFAIPWIIFSILVYILGIKFRKITQEFGFKEDEEKGFLATCPIYYVIFGAIISFILLILGVKIFDYTLLLAIVTSFLTYMVMSEKEGEIKQIWLFISLIFVFATAINAIYLLYLNKYGGLIIPSYIDLLRFLGYLSGFVAIGLIATISNIQIKKVIDIKLGVYLISILLFLYHLKKHITFDYIGAVFSVYLSFTVYFTVFIFVLINNNFGKRWCFIYFNLLFFMAGTILMYYNTMYAKSLSIIYSLLHATAYYFTIGVAIKNIKKPDLAKVIYPLLMIGAILLFIVSMPLLELDAIKKITLNNIMFLNVHVILLISTISSMVIIATNLTKISEGYFKKFIVSCIWIFFFISIATGINIMKFFVGSNEILISILLFLSAIMAYSSYEKLKKIV